MQLTDIQLFSVLKRALGSVSESSRLHPSSAAPKLHGQVTKLLCQGFRTFVSMRIT